MNPCKTIYRLLRVRIVGLVRFRRLLRVRTTRPLRVSEALPVEGIGLNLLTNFVDGKFDFSGMLSSFLWEVSMFRQNDSQMLDEVLRHLGHVQLSLDRRLLVDSSAMDSAEVFSLRVRDWMLGKSRPSRSGH